jgi:predicted Rossmann fold flavoprotein
VNLAEFNPNIEIIVLEKTSKLLSKVKISGGGRCNVTNACTNPVLLSKNYPRGEKKLKTIYKQFGSKETQAWFKARGVKLKTEADGRIFPISDNSQNIIDCLLNECHKHHVKIIKNAAVLSVEKKGDKFSVKTDGETFKCDKVLVASGGKNKAEAYSFLKATFHQIISPVPSLFTFNLTDKSITKLMGVSVPEVSVKIAGSKLVQNGPILVTHWGLSGPVILKLSAWGARELNQKDYKYTVLVNWLNDTNEQEALETIKALSEEHPNQKAINNCPFDLPKRLWEFLLEKAEIKAHEKWSDVQGKKLNKLVRNLTCDEYEASGKTTFKEEFVTCGGIQLSDIDFKTMESRICSGLYFAGEVLDIDGITGGFNFQAAWTTGYIAAKAMAE